MATKRSVIVEAKVEPGIVPVEKLTAKVETLTALGLPGSCAGGEILEDEALEDGQRWLVFRALGMLLGVAYEGGAKPWSDETVTLTVMEERERRVGMTRQKVYVAAALDACKVA